VLTKLIVLIPGLCLVSNLALCATDVSSLSFPLYLFPADTVAINIALLGNESIVPAAVVRSAPMWPNSEAHMAAVYANPLNCSGGQDDLAANVRCTRLKFPHLSSCPVTGQPKRRSPRPFGSLNRSRVE